MGYPSLGSWVTYGLGSEAENLPAFVVLAQPERTSPTAAAPCWGAGFLPAVPTRRRCFNNGPSPILNLRAPTTDFPPDQQSGGPSTC